MESKIIAKVGNKELTNEDFQLFLASVDPNIVRHFMSQPNGFDTMINEFINQELMLQFANKENMREDAEFNDILEKTAENLLKSYAYQKVINEANEPAEDEVKNYFNENLDEFKKTFVNASHILIESEELANEIYSKLLDDNSKFEELAMEYSTCPSKEKGGNLGDFTQGEMVKEFDDKVFSMKEGEISEPIKTEFGWHIIKLNKINSVQEPDFDSVKGDIKKELLRRAQLDRYTKKIDELKELFPVEISL
ncbi:MAG: peptidylprolyl isomerase [Ezakiella sp.]|nr:peptidylprolyl isomerase [Bacillota bacterium]MDY3946658.1 peptidylprolyl isomerase [Ezakiella sp.]